MFTHFWPEFGVLLAAAIVGSLAILPYGLRLFKESKKSKPLKMPLQVLMLLSVLQNLVLSAITIGVGLIAAHAIGLNAPLIESMITGKGLNPTIASMLSSAVFFGLLAGCFLLIADILFLPHFPEKLLHTAQKTKQLENLTASFYGGINEELLTRLFGFSVVTWLLSRIWYTSAGLPTNIDFWIANIFMALLFAIGHLPALKKLMGHITPLMLARTLLLNTPIGLLCGWLFWHYGIEAAVVAHFAADIVYHFGGTTVLRLNDQHHFIS